jgi:hypothetical protein
MTTLRKRAVTGVSRARCRNALFPTGSFVLLQACVYCAPLVFLFGAEFAVVYAQSYGTRAARK